MTNLICIKFKQRVQSFSLTPCPLSLNRQSGKMEEKKMNRETQGPCLRRPDRSSSRRCTSPDDEGTEVTDLLQGTQSYPEVVQSSLTVDSVPVKTNRNLPHYHPIFQTASLN